MPGMRKFTFFDSFQSSNMQGIGQLCSNVRRKKCSSFGRRGRGKTVQFCVRTKERSARVGGQVNGFAHDNERNLLQRIGIVSLHNENERDIARERERNPREGRESSGREFKGEVVKEPSKLHGSPNMKAFLAKVDSQIHEEKELLRRHK